MKRGRSYDWIPLWIDKWLLGSTRFELNPGERSVFLDLMILAAKDNGFIRANETMGYPHEWLSRSLNVPREMLDESVKKCIEYGKITDLGNGVYYVTNWEEYSLSGSHKRAVTLGIKKIPGSCEKPCETESVSKETQTVSPSMSKSKSSSSFSKEYAHAFETWWARYPRKIGKVDAEKAYLQVSLHATEPELLTALEAYRCDIAKNKTEEKFIKHPATFLRADRWKDYLSMPTERPLQVGETRNIEHSDAYWAEVRRLKEKGIVGAELTAVMAGWKEKP